MTDAQTAAWRIVIGEVRNRLLGAELQACYCAAIVRQTQRRHAVAKWVVAAAACVPFITKINSVSSDAGSWLAAVVPLIAIALPIWSPEKTVEVAAGVHGKYMAILPPLRTLWRDLAVAPSQPEQLAQQTIDSASKVIQEFDDSAATFAKDLPNLPDVPKLKARCARSVPNYDHADPANDDPRRRFADDSHVVYAPAAPSEH